MALSDLLCADVSLRNFRLTHFKLLNRECIIFLSVVKQCVIECVTVAD